MPPPRSFKSDVSFLEKIAMGALGVRQVLHDLHAQDHAPLELERGSTGYKIWKAIKTKRIRIPDLLCPRCGRRFECRAKTQIEISMSHSTSRPERGWDFGLEDTDQVALVQCTRAGPGPLDWEVSTLVQYIQVAELRRAWQENRFTLQTPKGAQEGFETRITWPAAVASTAGQVESGGATLQYRSTSGRRMPPVRLQRAGLRLTPQVQLGEIVRPGQILAAVVPVSTHLRCAGGVDREYYFRLAGTVSLSDRYVAVKALGLVDDPEVSAILAERVSDPKEHVYVRGEAAASLMRRHHPMGREYLAGELSGSYLESQLEAIIVLGEVGSAEAANLLVATLGAPEQHPEIRAAAAWALGEVGTSDALSPLVESFLVLEPVIRIEAARALAKLARQHVGEVVRALPECSPEQRPGVAWALGKVGGYSIGDLLPAAADYDLRQWVAYIVGVREPQPFLPEMEELARRDPEVYFAATMLWKLSASWIH